MRFPNRFISGFGVGLPRLYVMLRLALSHKGLREWVKILALDYTRIHKQTGIVCL